MQEENQKSALWIFAGILGVVFICSMLAFLALGITLSAGSRNSTSAQPTELPGQLSQARESRRRLSDVLVPQADLADIAERLLGLESIPRILAENAQEKIIGASESFWITNIDDSTTNQVNASLVAVTEHVYMWVGDGVAYDIEKLIKIVNYFESTTYPRLRSLLGSEWTPGIDGDRHIYILYVRGLGSSVAGLFFSKDETSSLAQEYSNEHEMFYLNADTLNLDSAAINSVLVHEFQHLIQWNLDRNEDTWMNEGLSTLSEFMLGYDPGGFDFLYAQETDIPLMQWPDEPGASAEHYGQAFLFLTYLYDRFGQEAIKTLAQEQSNGLNSVDRMLEELNFRDSVTGKSLSADRVYLDWAVSMAVQNPTLGDGRYGLRSYTEAPIAQLADEIKRCSEVSYSRQVEQYGIDLIKLRCEGDSTLTFSGETLAKVVPADAKSGDFAVWSNQGDDSDMTLTREFDLRNASPPVRFDYWTWYNIEDGYDYAYLEASIDGGATWQILQTPSGTDADPSGNSYGWAYTGVSGTGDTPQWIQETIDLSQFIGKLLLLRFEYITDSAVNKEGLLLDDIRLEALGYVEGFEDGDGGWQMKGFVRLYNRVPQTFELALVAFGEEVEVKRIEVSSTSNAEIDLSFEKPVDYYILVITGTARLSWLPANYVLRIEPR